jgi:transposase
MKYLLKKIGKSLKVGLQQSTKEAISLMQYLLAYQTKSQMHLIREKIVLYALAYGNQAAVDKFECHRNTVSKWKNRYKKHGLEGLTDQSRAPHHIPHKIIDQKTIDDICDRRDESGYGANRLKIQYDLWPSSMAINRILHEHDKIEPVDNKEAQKEDLWHIKRHFKTLETKLQLDGKYLFDIPNYLVYAKLLGLPKWEYTLRDVKSGATFLSYATTEDGLNACTFITYVFEHFKRHGIDVSKLTIQTDGASYAMNLKSLKKTDLQVLIEEVYGAKLVPMPQGGTSQSDVESFHSLVEREFYKRRSFTSIQDFFLQAYEFSYNFNFIRKNSHKDWQPPVYFLNQDRPDTPVEVLDLPPIYLDHHPEIYWCKLDPKHIPTQELQILDLTPDELPCEDFQPDEILQNFVRRVTESFSKLPYSAHDLPIYPKLCKKIMELLRVFNAD